MIICLMNGVLKLKYLKRSFKTSVMLLRAKERKIKAMTATLSQLNTDADSDDEFEEELEIFKDNFKIEGEDDAPSEESVLRKKAKQFRLTKIEKFVLRKAENWYNDATAMAEVFGVSAMTHLANQQHKGAGAAAGEVELKDVVVKGGD